MKRITSWSTLTLLVLMAASLACEGESPTFPEAPQPGGPGPAPTGQPVITLSVSNPNPNVGSFSIITATVTIDNQPAPPGTAVEFSTNLGTFTESNAQSVLRVTSGGTASATLTSSIGGTATVTARVGSSVRTTTVVFGEDGGPIEPDDPSITSIDPNTGGPAGGDLVTIVGRNFVQPVRVMFGDKQAIVLSVTSTQIRVSTPAIDLGASEQQRIVDVRVFTRAGTPEERRATSPEKFTYQLEILTPNIIHISPASGPNEGNTRITIFGEGFQPPTRAFFGTGGGTGAPLTDQVELEVLQVFFDRILAVTPPALGLGAALRDQQVTVRVLNTTTNRDAVLANAFRYGPEMQINTVEPLSGTALGGTRLTINGWGFDDPVVITVAGVLAQPIRVSGTQIEAVTGALLSPCESAEGPIIVTNVEDGATATFEGATFSYIGTQPSIIGVTPNPAQPGQAVTITVRNAGAGTIRFQLGSTTVLPTPASATNPQGDSAFTVIVPSNITFATEPCVDALGRPGVRSVPTVLNVTFRNITTGCEDTLTGGLTVNPTDLSCRVPPDAVLSPPSVAFTGTCGGPSNIVTITVTNAGGSPLTVNGITSSLANFQVVSGSFGTPIAPNGGSAMFTVQINPLPALTGTPPAPPPTASGQITVQTDDPTPPGPISATVTCTP